MKIKIKLTPWITSVIHDINGCKKKVFFLHLLALFIYNNLSAFMVQDSKINDFRLINELGIPKFNISNYFDCLLKLASSHNLQENKF